VLHHELLVIVFAWSLCILIGTGRCADCWSLHFFGDHCNAAVVLAHPHLCLKLVPHRPKPVLKDGHLKPLFMQLSFQLPVNLYPCIHGVGDLGANIPRSVGVRASTKLGFSRPIGGCIAVLRGDTYPPFSALGPMLQPVGSLSSNLSFCPSLRRFCSVWHWCRLRLSSKVLFEDMAMVLAVER
jgi:hypothetical protein